MVIVAYVGLVLVSYLLGSIPSGFLAARSRGIDLRTVGSGNIGATNAMRVLGKPVGLLVLLTDMGKGLLACLVVAPLGARLTGDAAMAASEWPAIAAGIAAILGHNFTCWLRFKGGKGIATSAGVLVVLMPKALGICLLVFLVVFAVGRIVSLASIAAAVALPIALALLGRGLPIIGVGVALGALAIHRHRANIRRLLAGTEPRIGRRADTDKAPPTEAPSAPADTSEASKAPDRKDPL